MTELVKPIDQVTTAQPSVIKARHFKVISSPGDIRQFCDTIKAFIDAGLSFQYIAKAGISLGCPVESDEVVAPMQTALGMQTLAGTIEQPASILAWQSLEKLALVPPLAAQDSLTGQELITISQTLVATEPAQKETKVLEGIAVFEKPAPLPQPADELANNPYLQSFPPELPKAA